MGLFKNKQSSSACDMCGKTPGEGCGSLHSHVEQISADAPAWLPVNLRSQAIGEYTWMCARCNSYPAMKWPGSGGAVSGMMIHLGRAHHIGMFGAGTPMSFEMRPVR